MSSGAIALLALQLVLVMSCTIDLVCIAAVQTMELKVVNSRGKTVAKTMKFPIS